MTSIEMTSVYSVIAAKLIHIKAWAAAIGVECEIKDYTEIDHYLVRLKYLCN
jgi:hypothetical protein